MKLSRSSLHTIATLIRPHKGLFLAGLFFLIGGTVVNLTVPELIRELINKYGMTFVYMHVATVAATSVGLFALQGVCSYGRSYLFGFLGQSVAAELRASLYEATLRQNIEFFDQSRASDLVSRLTADTMAIQDAVSIRLSVIIRYALQVILGAIAMAFISFKLTLVVLTVLAILVGISIVLGRSLRAISKSQQQALGAAAIVAQETFAAARIVKGFDREQSEITRFAVQNDAVLRLGLQRTRVSAFFQSFVSALLNSALALLVLYGVLQVFSGTLESGDLTAFLAYGAIVAVSFSFIAGSYAELSQALGASERVFELLERKLPPATRATPITVSPNRGAEIVFDQVSFSYPTRLDSPVLHSLSFTVKRGTTVALVGPSGAGKSTVVNLLLRFYDPAAGHILLDGTDLQDIEPVALRRLVSFVPQEPELFGVSIAENLRYGKADASIEELEIACKRAGILEFVQNLPQGFDTVAGDRGAQLSGGQKQRVAIARAMLRNPEVLILDEATSALDSENEALVQRALSELLKGRTAIVIAHRLATVKNADKVLVLDHGGLVQEGTHEDLAHETGLYRTLVERQELSSQSRDQ